ncbi:hypothetical protein ACF08N_38055 [Streptomyces sp. NPDC015127]|uniref:hypothetical protein n=1 Tax=Streptomyces sp. NPDC015127 TaxID=3364939 RepID=UPI0036FCEA58
MTTHELKRRMSALTTALGLGIALPFTLATPAHAQPILSIDKSHEGNFTRAGQGLYRITLTNTGTEFADNVELTDNLPTGLTVASLANNLAQFCQTTNGGTTVQCNFDIGIATGTLDIIVNIANNAPCSVVNTVTVNSANAASVSDSDQTTITGGNCNGGGGGGGSILPINLNGIIPMFNNISTNNNINSPNASNTNNQVFGVNTP